MRLAHAFCVHLHTPGPNPGATAHASDQPVSRPRRGIECPLLWVLSISPVLRIRFCLVAFTLVCLGY